MIYRFFATITKADVIWVDVSSYDRKGAETAVREALTEAYKGCNIEVDDGTAIPHVGTHISGIHSMTKLDNKDNIFIPTEDSK